MDINTIIEGLGNLIASMSVWMVIGIIATVQVGLFTFTTDTDEDGRLEPGSKGWIAFIAVCNGAAAVVAFCARNTIWQYQDWMPSQIMWTLATYLVILVPSAIYVVGRAKSAPVPVK